MANYKLLITAAGVGSRLNELTQYLNKSLVRIGRQPSLGYILDWAPADVPVVVVLGYLGNRVRDYLELAFPDRQFEFVTADPYEGPGSSMGASLLAAEQNLQCPFVLASCDTLVFGGFQPPDHNWIGVSESDDSAQYATVLTRGDKLLRINEKGAADFNYAWIGLNGIKDYESFWRNLTAARERNPMDSALNDCVAVAGMMEEGHSFTITRFPDWLDIGNAKTLDHARRKVPDAFDNIEKLEEAVYIREPDHVVKFFHDPATVAQRVRRAVVLGDTVPKLQGVRKNFYRYEYAIGDLLAPMVNEDIVDDLVGWCNRALWRPAELTPDDRASFKRVCQEFYKRKTHARLHQLAEKYPVGDGKVKINGLPVPALAEQLAAIDWDWVCDGVATGFHGDLHFENIIRRPDAEAARRFQLLDWRQDFGGIVEYGDIYYDLAKLNHGMLVSHDIVRQDLFTIKDDGDSVTCDILRPDRLVRCQERFLMRMREQGRDIAKIEMLTALIFLNIAALHHYPYNIFLYYYGRDRLERAARQPIEK